MITNEQYALAKKHFLIASEELGFKIEIPICLDKVLNLYAFAYLPDYGSENGAVISLSEPPFFPDDPHVIEWCNTQKVFHSCLNVEPLLNGYQSGYFRELLNDWKY